MKFAGMPAGMWLLFSGSFRKRLSSVLKYDARAAGEITSKAKKKYREIIASIPEFEKGDRFRMNLVNCAMLSAFLLSMSARPTVAQATDYYRESMMTGPMKLFCRMSGKRKFTDSDIAGMKKAEALNPADRNPYSWNMAYLPYEDGSGYEARFTTCGICVLMKELGLFDLVPAMCRLDYTMSEAGGASEFIRRYTLASGGPYCDCGYKKKAKAASLKEIPHNKGGWLASEFSVRRACKFRRLAGGKSRNLQDVHGGNGTARHAARLCGISLRNKRGRGV